jgi:hypothetical protein
MLGILARVAAILAVSGANVTWAPFKSSIYPYTILQPSSYKHIPIDDTSGRPVDYFFPSLGSSLTNVNVYCDHGHPNPGKSLRALGGKHVTRVGRILIDGTQRTLVRAEFSGLPGHWTVEQVAFSMHGHVWHLTLSYANQFRSQRPIMIKMLKSFKTLPAT